MKHLFEHWEDIQTQIQKANPLFLLFDYDGTLTPIVSQPDDAHCPLEVKEILKRLRDLPNVYLAIVSGRSLQDLKKRLGIPGIIYVGNHGLEIENPHGRSKKILSIIKMNELKRITHNLQNSLKDIPNIFFENKGPILSIHYRNVPQKFFTKIIPILEKELQPWGDRWKITFGKMVFEIWPNIDFHKGKAIREILKPFPLHGLLPIYLGDDRTDEDAFRELKGFGISVLVGPEAPLSEADFFLQDPNEVKEFLLRCHQIRTNRNALNPS